MIKEIIKPPSPHWVGNGFFVNGYFRDFLQENSPFLLLDYASKKHFDPSKIQRGVGSHPHRGFETVTIALSGKVAHHDSFGNSGIIETGDVQWMTAGSGILHQEYLEKEFNQAGGEFEMIQLWVNLPKKNKMTTPKYQAIKSVNIPKIQKEASSLEIIAGKFENTPGIASTFSPINIFLITLKQELTLEIPIDYNSMILVLEGNLEIDKQIISAKNLVILKTGILKLSGNAKFLFLSGQKIGEPIAHYGPFVMNERQELVQAIDDFNSGKFGDL
jgi:redox-sensitive bicupin YhaK (pirin superfamily)